MPTLFAVSNQDTRHWRMVMNSLGMNGQYTPRAPKTIIRAAIINTPDAVLTQRGRTHDARLDRHVEVRLSQYRKAMALANTLQRQELCMSCPLPSCQKILETCLKWQLKIKATVNENRLHTLRDLLVSLMPSPMMLPSFTKTQPTGTSSAARAFSACSLIISFKSG